MEHYDLIVVGAGSGGYVAAIRASKFGLKTAIIEKDKPGGTCLHRGCIPTKTLLHSAQVYSLCRNSEEYGVNASNVSIDFDNVHKRKDKIVEGLHKGIRGLLRKNKIDLIAGEGCLLEGKRVLVKTGEDDSVKYSADTIILAAGSRPVIPAFIPCDHKYIITSDDLLSMTSIPKSLLVAGAGAIGVEFASLYNSLGCKVVLVEAQDNILPLEDSDIKKQVTKLLTDKGIEILTSSSLFSAAVSGEEVSVDIINGKEKERRCADKMLVALGRIPAVEGLGLSDAGVEMDGKFVKVNEKLQTTVDGIFAIGDLVGPVLLAHAASAQGMAVANFIAGKGYVSINYNNIPKVTYSFPQTASAGLTEQGANDAGFRVKIGRFPFIANGKAAIIGDKSGFVKIVSDEASGKVLGVHMTGAKVSELIGEIPLALNSGLTVHKMSSIIHPHPSLSEVIQEAFHSVYGMAVHK